MYRESSKNLVKIYSPDFSIIHIKRSLQESMDGIFSDGSNYSDQSKAWPPGGGEVSEKINNFSSETTGLI